MTEEHADETMVASMRADAERQGADDRKVTDAPHYLARVLMANGIRNMYGVVGIPVTDFARIAQGMGMRFVGMRHEEDAVNAAAADGFITGRPAVTLTVSAPGSVGHQFLALCHAPFDTDPFGFSIVFAF